MLIERELTRHDLSLLAKIDRSELVEECYRVEDGQLVLFPVHFDMHGWPAGEVEENARTLEACLRGGGWLYGTFDGQTLVAAVVVDNRVIHNQGLSMRQLKFLHISRAYRGQGVGTKLFALACAQGRRFGAQALYVSATESRNTVEFYQRQGCQLLQQPDPELFALEPCDIHLYRPLN